MVAGRRIEALLRSDRALVLSVLVVITGLAWFYLFHLANGMNAVSSMSSTMSMTASWTVTDIALMFVMWVVMMVGMMLPSATPMVLLYGLVIRKKTGRGVVFAPTGVFVTGYLIAWAGFSVFATALQWSLEQAGLITSMTSMATHWFAGAILIAAGMYQWSPLKRACLIHCRNPMEFLSRSWRPGKGGAIVMGVHHGIYCIGCCWGLMLILFAGGVMNLLLVACIAALVLLEKIIPQGERTLHLTGTAAICAGFCVIIFG